MKPPDDWDRIERALREANPAPLSGSAGRAAEMRSRRDRIVAAGAPRRWRIPRMLGVAAGAAGIAAIATVLALLIIATPEEKPISAGGLGVSLLDRPASSAESPSLPWPKPAVEPATIRLALRADDLWAYVARGRDSTGALICLLIDPRQDNSTTQTTADALTICEPEEYLRDRGIVAEIAPGIIRASNGPDRFPLVALVPDGVESIEIAGKRQVVENNVARFELEQGSTGLPTVLRGPAALELRKSISPAIAQLPLDKNAPSVAVELFEPPSPPPTAPALPTPVRQPVSEVAKALEDDPSCGIDLGTLVQTHSQTSGRAFAAKNAAGAHAVIVDLGDGRTMSTCVAPGEDVRSPKRILVDYGIDSNLVAGVAPDGYTGVRAGSRLREVRENVFLVEQPTGIARSVTLSGPAGEVTLPVPPRAPVAPLPAPTAPAPSPLDEKLPLLRAGDLGRPRDTASLAELRGRPAFLLFVAPQCSACDEAIATLRDDARRETGREDVRPVVVSLGLDTSGSLNVLKHTTDGTVPVFRDPDGATAARFGVESLPGWVALDADGNAVGQGGTGRQPVEEALADAMVRVVIAKQTNPGCQLDPATAALVRTTRSGVRAYVARTATGRRSAVIIDRRRGGAQGLSWFSCDLMASGETRLEIASSEGAQWVYGVTPAGYTRASAAGVEGPVIDGVVLMEVGRTVTSVTLTGPDGTLVAPVQPRP